MTRSRFQTWLIVALLLLATIALYWPATRCAFINCDDDLFVTSNVHVQSGLTLKSIKWAFLNPVCWNWHPLTVLSHMADCQLFGLKPWGHHLTNVLLHALNTLLVFLLLRTLTGALWRNVLVAALFGLHPVHVESVVWVAERKDVLSACFGLLALLFYVRYAQRRSQGADHGSPAASSKLDVQPSSAINYSLSLAFFACGLMSKAMLVTWPFVMLLLDYWPLRRLRFSMPSVGRSKFVFSYPCLSEADVRLQSVPNSVCDGKSNFDSVQSVAKNPGLWRLVFEKIPFFALAAAASVVTFMVQKRGGALAVGESLSLGTRSANALISYCRYLGKMFWPTDLAIFYPHPGYWPIEQVLLAGVVLLGISVLLIAQRRRYPFLLMGWLWYCGTLLPVIQLVQTGAHAMADRYTYLPSLGVLILAVWGACELAGRWRYHVIVLSVAGTAALILCFGLTRQQIGYWQDSETLFRHALDVTRDNHHACLNLGGALEAKGRPDEAISFYREALRLKPDYVEAHNTLGAALVKQGQIDEAIGQFQEALLLKPDYAYAHHNLGVALAMKGQTDEAIRRYREALRLEPDFVEARCSLGVALVRKGQTGEAIVQFQEVLELQPRNAPAQITLGDLLLRMGRLDEAILHYRRALEICPGDAGLLNNLAWIRAANAEARFRDGPEAVRLAERACQVTEYKQPMVMGTLAAAYAEAGRFDEAMATAEKARDLAASLGRKAVADRNQELFQLYKAHKPFHEEGKKQP